MSQRVFRAEQGEVNLLVRSDGGTFLLDNNYTSAVVGGSGRRGLPGRAYYSQETNDRLVSTVTSGYGYQARTIELNFAYQGASRSTYLDFLDRFVEFVRPNTGLALALRNVRPDGRTRQIDVRLTSDLFFEEFTWGSRGLNEPLTFVADDPRWYNPTLVTVAVNDTVTGGFGFPIGFPISFVSGFVQENITYAGNVETHPILALTGPFQDAAVYNNTTGQVLRITSELPVSYTLVIDLAPGAVTAVDQAGNDYFLTLANSDLPNFVLVPGVNNLSFYASSHTTATTLTVSYYERYLNL